MVKHQMAVPTAFSGALCGVTILDDKEQLTPDPKLVTCVDCIFRVLAETYQLQGAIMKNLALQIAELRAKSIELEHRVKA